MHRRRSLALWLFFFVTVIAGLLQPAVSGGRSTIVDSLDPSTIPTGILYDLVAPFSRIEVHDGSRSAPPVGTAQWKQMVFELERAALSVPTWSPLARVLDQTRDDLRRGVVPLVVLSIEYNRIRPGAMEDGTLAIESNRLIQRGRDPYTRELAHAVTALKDYTHRGSDVTFVLQRNSYLTNLSDQPAKIEIDFDDGHGYTLKAFDQPAHVSYSRPGRKTIRTRITLAGGDVLYSGFVFDVQHLQTPTPHDTLTITATIPYDAGYGTG
ncbi:MAG: hypothetical protein JSW50_06065, partial [Candidatus Latescibacterota bacterium]